MEDFNIIENYKNLIVQIRDNIKKNDQSIIFAFMLVY